MEKTTTPNTSQMFSAWKVIIPIGIGLAVVVLMFIHDARNENIPELWKSLRFSWRTWLGILLAFLFTFGRVFGLSWRFRSLTDRQLKWRSAFQVDLLCEFTSCITPSAVGGSSLGMIFLNSKGLELGRATTLMITTIFLDELFFVVAGPAIVLLTPAHEIFASGDPSFSKGLRLTFWIVYGGICAWTLLLFAGIILRPHWIRTMLHKVFNWKWLRRWQDKATELGDNMVATSKELRGKPIKFWIRAFSATSLSWICRFLVVNAIFFAFLPQCDIEQWVIFARQLVIWVILMVSPTPGGAGLSEWLFSGYYGDLVPAAGIALILAIFWRFISYYIFLFIGAIIIPGWIKATYLKIKSK